ncbi:MAG TPA: PRC-barrel domain-containing protein [Abditibacteriaceae bacterium]|jgi:uncharacterized protein YrrD
MRKGKSIIGLNILSQNDATELGKVRDLIFDHDTDELLAILVSEKDLFGLIDAQVVPWSEVRAIGPHAVMVPSPDSKIKAGDFPRVRDVMNRETALSGTRIVTQDGRELGTLADMYIDDETGKIVGYEVSGGFFSDTMSGKRFMDAIPDMPIGKGVAVVPSGVADHFEQQKSAEPGGLSGAAHSAGEKLSGAVDTTKEAVSGAYDSAKTSATGAYAGIASASVEKQKEFVVGKVASREVMLPATEVPSVSTVPGAEPPIEMPSSTLVRQGDVITRETADRAQQAGVLGQLVVAAGGGVASGAASTAGEHAGGIGASVQGKAENAAVGKPAGREVTALNGETIIAPGQIITEETIERARRDGKEKEVIASAGFGAAAAGVDTVKEGASNLWDTIKHKAEELTGAAHDKKAEYDTAAEQSKINNALGRPTTRVILDQSDAVILNTGDLITHAAIERSRTAGVLDILLDSVYVADPEITPEMMRAKESGEAALPTQAQPTGGPITATVAPGVQSQDSPAQDNASTQLQ